MSTTEPELAAPPVLFNPTDVRPLAVLAVDDDASARSLLRVLLAQAGHSCQLADSAQEALRILESQPVDAVVSDLQMPGMSGLELLSCVRRLYPHVAFVMVTGVDDIQVGVRAMQEGADDYLVKPFHVDASIMALSLSRAVRKKELEQTVENYRRHLEDLVAQRTRQLQEALRGIEASYRHTLEVLGAAIDLRDGPTAGHSRRVCLYSLEIAKALGGLDGELKTIAMGAWLHDIGKLAIPDSILLKPGILTSSERQVMERHARLGYDLVKEIPFLAGTAEIILAHHERWDGTGYPRRIVKENIPLGARIFAVADSFDAMTSDRPYRPALSFEAARAELTKGAGCQFDSKIVEAFLSIRGDVLKEIIRETASIPLFSIAAANDAPSPLAPPEG